MTAPNQPSVHELALARCIPPELDRGDDPNSPYPCPDCLAAATAAPLDPPAMPTPSSSSVQPALRVTVEDLETGQSSSREVHAGDYIIVTAAPCFLDGVQAYSTRTHVLTVKGRTAT